MEYMKNHKKFLLTFKKEVAMEAVANKWKLVEEKPDDVWNPKKRRWTKPASQVGYKALTVWEMFTDMKDEVNESCVKFVTIVKNVLKKDNLILKEMTLLADWQCWGLVLLRKLLK